MAAHLDPRLERIDDNHLTVANGLDVDVVLTANRDVPVEKEAVDELLKLLEVQTTVARLANHREKIVDLSAGIERVALTPDFHRGSGVPIGTVIRTNGFILPQAVGSDVNCGMRLVRTSVTEADVRSIRDQLEARLRYVFFEGGRRIGLTPFDREALLRVGLPGLLDSLGSSSDPTVGTEPVAFHGETALAPAFADWVQSAGGTSFDGVIGNVGGGNHFVEVQYVRQVLDGAAAHAWQLRAGDVVIMAHSGSLGLGHTVKHRALEMVRAIYPRDLPFPDNGVFPLPLNERHADQVESYLCLLRNAANFAFGNRYFLTKMVTDVIASILGDVDARLVYDAPHNLAWVDGTTADHRKGATPAAGPSEHGPGGWLGEPVIVPGSMGSSSFLLRGLGDDISMCSACHGAGRAMSRGAAAHADEHLLDRFLEEFRVVTPVDVRRPDIARRADIVARWRRDLMEEAPYAYKDITPIVTTLSDAGVAEPVVELSPLLTIKS